MEDSQDSEIGSFGQEATCENWSKLSLPGSKS